MQANTVEAIMDAAERRIRELGYNGFSFRDIAADVGIKSASVHHHFPTKPALAAVPGGVANVDSQCQKVRLPSVTGFSVTVAT